MTWHEHEYVAETRPGWSGYNCRVCGFHVQGSAAQSRAVQDRVIPRQVIDSPENCCACQMEHYHAGRAMFADHSCRLRVEKQGG